VIGRSLDPPEALGPIYDQNARSLLRFLGRRVGAEAAEGLAGKLFRIAFERRKTFDVSRASARMAANEVTDRRASVGALHARVLFPRVADAIEARDRAVDPLSDRTPVPRFVTLLAEPDSSKSRGAAAPRAAESVAHDPESLAGRGLPEPVVEADELERGGFALGRDDGSGQLQAVYRA
jgi:hypothetical protein